MLLIQNFLFAIKHRFEFSLQRLGALCTCGDSQLAKAKRKRLTRGILPIANTCIIKLFVGTQRSHYVT